MEDPLIHVDVTVAIEVGVAEHPGEAAEVRLRR